LKVERRTEAIGRVFADILDRRIDLEPLGRRAAAVIWRDFHLGRLVVRIEEALERAARQPRAPAASPAEVYRLALLTEKLSRALTSCSWTGASIKPDRTTRNWSVIARNWPGSCAPWSVITRQ